jgi:hypothetical protein
MAAATFAPARCDSQTAALRYSCSVPRLVCECFRRSAPLPPTPCVPTTTPPRAHLHVDKGISQAWRGQQRLRLRPRRLCCLRVGLQVGDDALRLLSRHAGWDLHRHLTGQGQAGCVAAAAAAHGKSCIIAVEAFSNSTVAAAAGAASQLLEAWLLTCVAALLTGVHHCDVRAWRT